MAKLFKQNKGYLTSEVDVEYEIDQYLLLKQRESNKFRKSKGFFHPSLLSKGIDCERWWYYYLSDSPASFIEDPNSDSLNIMAIGKAYHDKYQELLYEMDVLEGVWKCIKCDHTFWATSPDECPNCDTRLY